MGAQLSLLVEAPAQLEGQVSLFPLVSCLQDCLHGDKTQFELFSTAASERNYFNDFCGR